MTMLKVYLKYGKTTEAAMRTFEMEAKLIFPTHKTLRARLTTAANLKW